MSLNADQQKGFMDVIKFINDPTQKYMDISGGAGTGKTYFISKIVDDILKHKVPDCPLHSVAITATTNKAAAVISDAMPHRAGEIGTIYSFMNLRLNENFQTGETKVVPTAKWFVHSGTFVIIDECSMVNTELFKYLEKGLDQTCKILFVGDKNQLAPVKETLSPIYRQGFNSTFLTQPVRNALQPALMALCEQAKQTVLTGVFTPIEEVPGVIDFVDGEQLKGVLEREFLAENPGKRVLSYTNKRVVQYNEYIRRIRGYSEPFEEGEILSNNSSAELLGKERLYTDQIVRVIKVLGDDIDRMIVPKEEIRTVRLLLEDVLSKVRYEVTSFAYPSDREAAIKFYSSRKDWEKYFKVKNNFPDLRSVAASTTHKAQGSTYDSVVVDLADIGNCTNKEQTARMQYVALSRPRTGVVIRGQLPERYFQ
jgi:AAA domain/UvrD-like helicase C-terminal domain